ncbi:MAG: hypothetical protein CME15_00910 [Gemmatimonadetes bacterium]|nr:hypothetical protein [Gemmatimonadota bacterium]
MPEPIADVASEIGAQRPLGYERIELGGLPQQPVHMLGIADEDVREKTTVAQQAQQRISQRF